MVPICSRSGLKPISNIPTNCSPMEKPITAMSQRRKPKNSSALPGLKENHRDLITGAATSVFRKLKTNIDSGTPTFIQDAAIAALNDEKHVEKMRNDYRQKRDIMVQALTKAGLEDCTPQATLYIWQKTPLGINSVDFAKMLLRKEIAMVVTPGSWISKTVDGKNPGQNYVRFALVPTAGETLEAARRIKKYHEKILALS